MFFLSDKDKEEISQEFKEDIKEVKSLFSSFLFKIFKIFIFIILFISALLYFSSKANLNKFNNTDEFSKRLIKNIQDVNKETNAITKEEEKKLKENILNFSKEIKNIK